MCLVSVVQSTLVGTTRAFPSLEIPPLRSDIAADASPLTPRARCLSASQIANAKTHGASNIPIVTGSPKRSGSRFGSQKKSELQQEMQTLLPQLKAIQKAFKAVEDIIKGLPNGDSSLLLKWRSIKSSYENVLNESCDQVMATKVMIDDIVDIIIPYLLDPVYGIQVKIDQLNVYGESLEDGLQRAKQYAESFAQIADAVIEFKNFWKMSEKEIRLRHALEQLGFDLKSLTNRISQVQDNLSTLAQEGIEGLDTSILNGDLATYMDKMNDKEVYGLKELRKAGLKMAKHASAIEENTTGLSKLWLFIRQDLIALKHSLDKCKSSPFQDYSMIFCGRVEKLKKQYIDVGAVMGDYASAMTQACVRRKSSKRPTIYQTVRAQIRFFRLGKK